MSIYARCANWQLCGQPGLPELNDQLSLCLSGLSPLQELILSNDLADRLIRHSPLWIAIQTPDAASPFLE